MFLLWLRWNGHAAFHSEDMTLVLKRNLRRIAGSPRSCSLVISVSNGNPEWDVSYNALCFTWAKCACIFPFHRQHVPKNAETEILHNINKWTLKHCSYRLSKQRYNFYVTDVDPLRRLSKLLAKGHTETVDSMTKNRLRWLNFNLIKIKRFSLKLGLLTFQVVSNRLSLVKNSSFILKDMINF